MTKNATQRPAPNASWSRYERSTSNLSRTSLISDNVFEDGGIWRV